MDHDDPIAQFFPYKEEVNLYHVLSLESSAKLEDIKKAYRRLALVYHPDKQANASEEGRAEASIKFQQVGFAYAVLGDEKRRARYDKTGLTDEGLELQAGEDGWEAYFSDLFDRVTKGKLDEMKKDYQGSAEEGEDIKRAYVETSGSIEDIMSHIPHSTHEDESRFIALVMQFIKNGELDQSDAWEKSIKDTSRRMVRKKQAEKEAEEAEELAKELGVWDEFYGNGKGQKKGRGGKAKAKGNAESSANDEESILQAMILKRKKNMDGFFDSLAAKYTEPGSKGKGKGKKRAAEADETETPKTGKKAKSMTSAPDINEEEFQQLQQKLFGKKTTEEKDGEEKRSQANRTRKTRKNK